MGIHLDRIRMTLDELLYVLEVFVPERCRGIAGNCINGDMSHIACGRLSHSFRIIGRVRVIRAWELSPRSFPYTYENITFCGESVVTRRIVRENQ